VLADVTAKARGELAVIAPLALEAVKRIDAIFDIEREINGLPAEPSAYCSPPGRSFISRDRRSLESERAEGKAGRDAGRDMARFVSTQIPRQRLGTPCVVFGAERSLHHGIGVAATSRPSSLAL
jgi:hypothetical protein